jgi:hypothetical protein
VSDFLSEQWFAQANARLTSAAFSAAPLEERDVVRVVLQLDGAPPSLPQAVTFAVNRDGASLSPGEHAGADLVVRLSFEDAEALVDGEFDGARALRDGRLKVRGDVNALTPLGQWLSAAHRSTLD